MSILHILTPARPFFVTLIPPVVGTDNPIRLLYSVPKMISLLYSLDEAN